MIDYITFLGLEKREAKFVKIEPVRLGADILSLDIQLEEVLFLRG